MARHHYVPQFYLKNFSVRHKPGYVYAYRRGVAPFLTTTKNIAQQKDFYSAKKVPGMEAEDVEKILAIVDWESSKVLKKILAQDSLNISEIEKCNLAYYLTLQFVRNISFRQKNMNMMSGMSKIMMKFAASNKEFFKKSLQKTHIEKSDKEIEDLRKFTASDEWDVTFNTKDPYFTGLSLDLSLDLYPFFLNKHYLFLKNETSRCFITSDNPIVILKSQNLPPHKAVGLLEGAIAWPISPSRLLILHNDNHKFVKTINREHVNFLNWQQMTYAHRAIYSNVLSKELQAYFNKTQNDVAEKIVTSALA